MYVRDKNTIFFIVLSGFFALSSFLITMGIWTGMSKAIIIIGTLSTTATAIINPIFSFKVEGTIARIYSLYFGIFVAAVLLFTNYVLNFPVFNYLMQFFENGLIWSINMTLLLSQMAYLSAELERERVATRNREKIEDKERIANLNKEKIKDKERIINLNKEKIKDKERIINLNRELKKNRERSLEGKKKVDKESE